MWRRALGVALGWGATMLVAHPAASQEPLRWHLDASGAHAIGDPQSREYGFGAVGSIALEVPIRHAFGAQLETGGLWLPHGSAPRDPTLADHGDGTALFAMLGLRARPFTEVAGPWVDVGAGYLRTGDRDRFGFDAHVGYDWRIGEDRWDIGPFVGYLHVVQPKDTLRPEDANILALGIHIALGAEKRPPPVEASNAPPPPPPLPPPPPPPSPPPPPPDRDGDGVPDAVDACPDVPGIKSDDPKTNGCPAAGDQVRVIKDHIEYDDVILFDKDQTHVHHASWPILKKLAVFINAHPDFELVDITGHADERGSAEYNLRLSQERAIAVKGRLVQYGVNPARLTTIGYGTARPRAEGHSESDWRQNRRVEFIITKVTNAQGGSTSIKQPEPAGQSK